MNIGIDLGTTFSAAAWQDDNGVLSVITNSEGGRLTPSVVMEDENGSIVVGSVAKDSAVIMAGNVVSAAKDFMGTKHTYTMPSGRKLTPEEISGFILKKIKQDCEKKLGQAIDGVVITVPAYFTDAQRKATEDAGRIAGLNVIRMINEPTAAAIYYAHINKITDANVLVYDLGGGTFDASIVYISDEEVEVKSTGGHRKLGGHFFDTKILEYVIAQLDEKYNDDEDSIDLYDDEYKDELQELNQKAEECKIQLSVKESAAIVIKIDAIKEKLTITRAQFEAMIKGDYDRTESKVRAVLREAKMTWKDIDKILLVGGSSRIPMIADRLRSLSDGIEPSQEVNPDEAVALGAAIYANRSPKKIIDVNSHSLGVVGVDKTTELEKNIVIIKRGTMLPAQGENRFSTYADTSQITVRVTEGEGEDLEFVTVLAELDIDLPPNTPKRTPVTIEMKLDQNQLLRIYTRVATTPEVYKEIPIPRKSNLSEKDIKLKTALVSETTVQ